MYLYIRTNTWMETIIWTKKETAPLAGRRSEHGRGLLPAESGEGSDVRHEEQAANRMVDLLSS